MSLRAALRSCRHLGLSLCVASLGVGCKPSGPASPATPAKAKAKIEYPSGSGRVEHPDRTRKREEEALADARKTDTTKQIAALAKLTTVPPPAPAPTSTAPPPPTYGVERILILAPQNPLVVELRISIDGRPHVEALEQLVAHALKLADTDGDGRAMWDELTASPRFKYGQFGNLPIDGANGPKQIVERYDIDRDGVVDDTELPRFLTRNAGGSRPFSIRGTVDDSPSAQSQLPLWQLLDVDEDSRLAAEEIAGAAQRLRSRDVDDDEILISAELMPASSAMPGAMMATRRRSGREAARLLGSHAQWDAVRTVLEEQYALGGALAADDFPLTPELFSHLDADQDGRMRRKEIERLNDAPPDIVLAVRLRSQPAPAATGGNEQEAEAEAEAEEEGEKAEAAAEADKAESDPSAASEAETLLPRLELVSFGEHLQGIKTATVLPGDRLLLHAGGTSLLVYLNDTVAATNYVQQAEQGLAAFDGDKNGYLEPSEVNEGAQRTVGRFEAVDTDGDGKVYAGEIATYLEQQQQALRSQVHARVAGKPDSLRETLDQNDDGRIDSRETERAAERLQSLDTNGDGEIDLDEVPAGLVLGIARGSLENQDALFTMPATTPPTPAADSPRWFQQTDANRDGSISPREFLGPLEWFEKLDANGDGFLTADEAT